MGTNVAISAEGEGVNVCVEPDYPGPYSAYVRFLRQQLPGIWIDWVAAREAYRFGRGRPFPIGWRNADAALDERAKIRFSPDGLRAYLVLYPPRGRGRRLTEQELIRVVKGYGVPVQILDSQALRLAFLRRSYHDPEAIAAGRPPRDGAAARIDWARGLPSDPESFLSDLDARGSYPDAVLAQVAEGEAIGIVSPPAPGLSGLSAWGAPLPARPGENRLRWGEGLTLEDDGRTVRALRSGHLRLTGSGGADGRVLPLLVVREAQDLEPWRGRIFPGSLIVLGDLEVRFPLKVMGDVEVRGGLVRSSLEVMGSLFVREGVIQRGYEPVRVGGILSAAFMDRAWAMAHTIHVRRYSLQSRLLALDAVIARAAGANLCGGQIASRRRIEAETLGSPNSMETEVLVGSTAQGSPFPTLFQSWGAGLRELASEEEAGSPAVVQTAEEWEAAAVEARNLDLSEARISAQKVHSGVSVRVAGAVREIGNTIGPVSFTYERIGDRDRVAMSRG